MGDLFRFRLPTPRWRQAGNSFALPNGTLYTISGTGLALIADDVTLETFKRGVIDAFGPPSVPRLSASPDRTVAGEEGYVVSGEGREGYFYKFGTIYRDHIISIQFIFPRGGERSEEWVESVLASVEWL